MEAVHANPLDALKLGAIRPDYALTPAEYAERVICVAVYPVMESGRICLAPADDGAERALDRVRSALESAAPAETRDAGAWAVLKVRELLERVNAIPQFAQDDAWGGSLAGQPILVVKQGSLDSRGMTLETAVRRAHRILVAAALQKGWPVPIEVAREHGLDLEASGERELT